MCSHNNTILTDQGYHSCMDCGSIDMNKVNEYDHKEFGLFYNYDNRFFTTQIKYSNKYKHLFKIQKRKNNNISSRWFYYNKYRVPITCMCGKKLFQLSLKYHLTSHSHRENMKLKNIDIPISNKGVNEYSRNKYKKNTEVMKTKVLNYYYKTRRDKVLKKVDCECGRTVSRGNLKTHLKSNIHKKGLKSKKN